MDIFGGVSVDSVDISLDISVDICQQSEILYQPFADWDALERHNGKIIRVRLG